tara:strand:- start:257 stop:829 length:573 start_codon:yes stop_codon:yes gene_type:complete
MRYKYKITEEELKQAFGDLLEIDLYEDEILQAFGDLNEESEFKTLTRKGQDSKKTYQINIQTPNQAKILLDYLSYDNSGWDYEPKLCISMFGTIINFQRRGNMGHIHQLEDGDMLIMTSWIREKYAERILPAIPIGDKNLRAGYYALLKANESSESMIATLRKEIERLSNEISVLKDTNKKTVELDDLPF